MSSNGSDDNEPARLTIQVCLGKISLPKVEKVSSELKFWRAGSISGTQHGSIVLEWPNCSHLRLTAEPKRAPRSTTPRNTIGLPMSYGYCQKLGVFSPLLFFMVPQGLWPFALIGSKAHPNTPIFNRRLCCSSWCGCKDHFTNNTNALIRDQVG